jgi:hypothetical protein
MISSDLRFKLLIKAVENLIFSRMVQIMYRIIKADIVLKAKKRYKIGLF